MPSPQTPRRTTRREDAGKSPIRPHTTHNTPQSPSLKPPNGPIDIGKRQGPHDTDILRSRVYKWQHQNSGAWESSDAGDKSEDAPSESPTKSWPRGRLERRPAAQRSGAENEPPSYVNAYRPAGFATYQPRHNKIDDDIRAAASPKKRLVSDEHWKKNRASEDKSSASSAPDPPPMVQPAPLLSSSPPKLAQSHNVSTLPHKACDAWVRRKPNPEREMQELEEKITSGVHMTPTGWVRPHRSPDKTPVKPESPKRYEVHVTPEGFVRQRSQSPEKLFPNDAPKQSAKTPVKKPQKVHNSKSTPLFGEAGNLVPEDRSPRLKPQRSIGAGLAPAANKPKKVDGGVAQGKDNQGFANMGKNNLDRRKTPGMDSKPSAKIQNRQPSSGTAGPGQQKPTRIEAWLGAMPDPFVEDPEKLDEGLEAAPLVFESEIETTPKVRPKSNGPRRRGRDNHGSHEDRKGGEKETTDNESPWTADDEFPVSPSSGPTLKRRGAKRNLQSPKKKTLHQDESHGELSPSLQRSPPVDGSAMDFSGAVVNAMKPLQTGKRHSPTTSNRLSPVSSKSVATPCLPTLDSVEKKEDRPILKRKLTTHADLISVLSMERGDSKSIRSARSIRTIRNKPETANLDQLQTELRTDESKYLRELRTLVDGVIPVLLNCVLSKTNTNAAASLFGRSTHTSNATQPIVSMGIAVERLKSTHNRLPYGSVEALVFWAQSTHRVYGDYIKSWRLGFEDVVVNLAPVDGKPDSGGVEDDLARNHDGDVVNGDGEKVDVAFLLKRPLVRVKCLAKTLKAIAAVQKSSKLSDIADKYQDLVAEARKRQDDERGRLEDEAAASLDVTRTRSLKNLAPLTGIWIEPSRCVKARDVFDLKLQHSSGQQLDCRVELIIRDEPPNKRIGGDVLICELDHAARWLLLPPVLLRDISARTGDENELVVLIKGGHSNEEPWQELLSLKTGDTATLVEWEQMLGTDPVPPELPNQHVLDAAREADVASKPGAGSVLLPSESGGVSLSEIDVPIGEQASVPPSVVPSLIYEESISDDSRLMPSTISFDLPEPVALPKDDRNMAEKRPKPVSAPISFGFHFPSTMPAPTPKPRDDRPKHGPRDLDEAMAYAGTKSPRAPSAKHEPPREYPSTAPTSPAPSEQNQEPPPRANRPRSLQSLTSSKLENLEDYKPKPRPPHHRAASSSSLSSSSKGYSVWLPHDANDADEDDPHSLSPSDIGGPLRRDHGHRHAYSAAMSETPFLSKIRDVFKSSKWDPQPIEGRMDDHNSLSHHHLGSSKRLPKPLPGHARGASLPANLIDNAETQTLPKTPPHRSPVQLPGSKTPVLRPTSSTAKSPGSDPPASDGKTHRRTSSPLKRQYEPSSDSDDSSVDANVLSDDDESVSSESSAEDFVPSLPPSSAFKRGPKSAAAPDSIYQPRHPATLAPSQSASQPGSPAAGGGGNKQIASIFCWSDKGLWESLHPDECSVIVSAGLIEAFEMSAAHSIPNKAATGDEALPARPEGIRPLVGLELTPLVPLRRGTAIDISIRSPPTADSQIKKGNNVMFRSRNNQECDILYNLINQARINNPTFIALQNARSPFGEGTWAAAMDRRSNGGPAKSWWRLGGTGRGRGSYRAGDSRRTPSVAGHTDQTESSVATMSTAISALKRFSAGNKMFDVAKSSVQPRGGLLSPNTRSSTTFSSEDSAGPGSGASTPPAGTGVGADPSHGTALGIRGAKIRLYERESAGKWRDMGSARLTIMHPPRPPGAPPPLMKDGSLKQEKRVVVTGKTKGETLLDVTLGETSFERVARTGIAVSVWEQGEVGKRGSVMTTKVRVFMVQMKSERDTAYTFSLVGRLRY